MLDQFCAVSATQQNLRGFIEYIFPPEIWDYAFESYTSLCARRKIRPSVVLYGFAIRQNRVVPILETFGLVNSVSITPEFNDDTAAASASFYGLYKPFDASAVGFTNANLFFWQQELDAETFVGNYATYPSSGFQVVFPSFGSSFYNTIYKFAYYAYGGAFLKYLPGGSLNAPFIDDKTRIIISDLVYYNPGASIFLSIEFVNEISSTGSWKSYVNYYAAPAPQVTNGQGLDTSTYTMGVFTAILIIFHYARFIRNFAIYDLDIWVVVHLLHIVLLGFVFAFTMEFLFFPSSLLDIPSPRVSNVNVTDPLWICERSNAFGPCTHQPPYYRNISVYCKWFTNNMYIMGLVAFLEVMIIARNVLQSHYFKNITRAMNNFKWNMGIFFVLLLVEITGFAASGSVFFFRPMSEQFLFLLLCFTYTSSCPVPDVTNGYWFYAAYFLLFGLVFLLLFQAVNLAIIYSGYNTALRLQFLANDNENQQWQEWKIKMLWDPSKYKQTKISFRKSFRRFLRDSKYRSTKMRSWLAQVLAIRIRDWLPADQLLVNVLRYKVKSVASSDPSLLFIRITEAELGNAVLGGGLGSLHPEQMNVIVDALEDELLTKIEVEARIAALEFSRDNDDTSKELDEDLAVYRLRDLKYPLSLFQRNQATCFEAIDIFVASFRVFQNQLTNQLNALAPRIESYKRSRLKKTE